LAETELKGIDYPHINTDYVEDENELKNKCDTYFTTGMQGRWVYMMQWMQNVNFLAGNQWISFNPMKKEFEIDANLDDECRVTVNKILPAYRTAVGSLLRDRQMAKVLQQSDDEEAIDASKVKTRLLEHCRRVNRGLNTQKEALEWAAITGKGINKKVWDPEEEKIVDEVLQTFEFITPSNVRKLSKMPWVCHARYETTEWVYESFGIADSEYVKDEKTKPKVTVTGTSDYGQYGSFLSAVKHVMDGVAYTGNAATMNNNNVLVREYWFRPCKMYPDGLLAIKLNDELIYADRNPFCGKLDPKKKRRDFYFPFNEMNFFDLPFRYWPMSLIEPVIGLQIYRNKFESFALDAIQTNGFATWWAQNGTVSQDEIVTDGKTVNFYDGQQHPVLQNGNSFDPKLFEIISQMDQGIGEIVGIHQFGRGGLPPGVHAAAALAIINEQDQITKMGLTVNLEEFMRNDAEQTLYLVRKFWPDSFKIRYMGKENKWEVTEFDQTRYEIGDEEIEIESKQELAQDKMTRFDQVFKMMTTARLDNPKEPIIDVNEGLRMLDLNGDMGTVDSRSLNWNLAKTENEEMGKGKRVAVFPFQDHKQHIEAVLEVMLRVDFSDMDKDKQQLYIEHYQEHMMMLNGAQQSIGAQASQSDGQQQPMMGMPMMGGQMPQMQPQMGQQPMPGNVVPMQGMQPPMQGQPMQMPPPPNNMPTGLASGLQSGMTNVLHQAAGIPGAGGR
jgi:hypothetical protein